MKAKVFCMASAKGGSGKTVLCASFAWFLSSLGKKTLIVDADMATHGLTLLYMNEVKNHADEIDAVYEAPSGLFGERRHVTENDIVNLGECVDFLPATYDFRSHTGDEAFELTKVRLLTLLRVVRPLYDYVFIDAQAGADGVSRLAMSNTVSDEVIIVSEYDPLSAAGVERMKALLHDDLTYMRTWILLNKMLPEFAKSFGDFMEVNKYLSPIPWDPDVVRAYARRRLPLDLESGNDFTLAIMRTLKALLGPAEAAEIDKWALSRAARIREPLQQQYHDAEMELEGLLAMESKLKIREFKRRLWTASIPLAASAGIVGMITGTYSDWGVKLLLFCVVAAVLIGLFIYLSSTYRPFIGAVDEAKIRRQKAILEDRLQRLEMLRTADLPELLKARERI